MPGDLCERFPCRVDLNQLTAMDEMSTTDTPSAPLLRGFLYLVANMNLYSTRRHSWKLLNSMRWSSALKFWNDSRQESWLWLQAERIKVSGSD